MLLFLAWAAGRTLASLTEIEKAEGRTDIVGEDGKIGFGCVELRCTWEIQPLLFSWQT